MLRHTGDTNNRQYKCLPFATCLPLARVSFNLIECRGRNEQISWSNFYLLTTQHNDRYFVGLNSIRFISIAYQLRSCVLFRKHTPHHIDKFASWAFKTGNTTFTSRLLMVIALFATYFALNLVKRFNAKHLSFSFSFDLMPTNPVTTNHLVTQLLHVFFLKSVVHCYVLTYLEQIGSVNCLKSDTIFRRER